MHLHDDHSYAHSIHCAYNSQSNFRFLGNAHRLAIWCHFLDRSKHDKERFWHQDIQVHDTRRARRLYPSGHRK